MAKIFDLQQLIEVALSENEGKSYLHLFEIEEEFAAKIEIKTGINLQNYTVVIEADTIRHILHTHGHEIKEIKKGQLAVTIQDLALIPQIIKEADIIEKVGKNKRGLDVLRFIKQIGNEYYIVEEIRTGRKHLALSTMYIKNPPIFGKQEENH